MIRYHVVEGVYSLADLQQMAPGSILTSMASANNITVTQEKGEIFLSGGQIVAANLPAINGVIHIINKVLEPYPITGISQSLHNLFHDYQEFSIFAAHLQRFGLIEELDNMTSQYTLFAPVDEAPESGYRRKITKSFLKYFVVPQLISTTEVGVSGKVSSPTLLGDGVYQRVNITATGHWEVRMVNGYPVKLGPLLVGNGVVYGISRVLRPILNKCDTNFEDKYVYKCCPGYFDIDCGACPGGAESPCSGQGICDDGRLGRGHCRCDEGYTGDNCAECVPGSGIHCPLDILCKTDNGGCHEFAKCSVNVTSKVICSCMMGYIGDGLVCQSPCDIDNGDCHPHAKCTYDTQEEKVMCSCLDGYHGNGKSCIHSDDICFHDNGGCSQHATCFFNVTMDDPECSCKPGFVGNGTMCNGAIYETLAALPQTRYFYEVTEPLISSTETILTRIKHQLENPKENLTMFVPVMPSKDEWEKLTAKDIANLVLPETIYLSADKVDNDTYYRSLAECYLQITYTIHFGKPMFTVNGVEVLEPNIPTVNGLIHLVKRPLLARDAAIHERTMDKAHLMLHSVGMVVGVFVGLIFLIVLGLLITISCRKVRPNWVSKLSLGGYRFQALDEDSLSQLSVDFHSGRKTMPNVFTNATFNAKDESLSFPH